MGIGRTPIERYAKPPFQNPSEIFRPKNIAKSAQVEW
jgi:hypothetical protein